MVSGPAASHSPCVPAYPDSPTGAAARRTLRRRIGEILVNSEYWTTAGGRAAHQQHVAGARATRVHMHGFEAPETRDAHQLDPDRHWEDPAPKLTSRSPAAPSAANHLRPDSLPTRLSDIGEA